jgi:hypothetical protein
MNRPPHPAAGLVGAPYKRGGTHAGEGFDCFTLLAHVRRVYYNRDTPTAGIPAGHLNSAQAAALGIYRALGGYEHVPGPWVSCDPTDGCAVALGRRLHGRLHHCGVLIAGDVLHAMESVGVALSPIERIFYLYSRVECFECRT